MGKTHELSCAARKAICDGRKLGIPVSTLCQQFSVTKKTIYNITNRYESRKHHNTLSRSGRPRKTTLREDSLIVRTSKFNPRLNAVDIKREMNITHGVKLSQSTIQRRLRAEGLLGRRPAKKPLVSLKNRLARVAFAKKHQHWTSAEWRKVVFSDESSFLSFGSDGISYVRRPESERFNPRYQLATVKHGGGKVMVWGCFSLDGVGPLVCIRGTMDRYVYKDILETHMLPHARRVMGRGWIFQQDNDPKHTSAFVSDWFHQRRVNLLEWPSQSPDLNPIEHLWEELGRKCHGLKASNMDQKFAQLEQKWTEITPACIQKLIDSMPSRCEAVIKSRGYPTKY